jgi:hypothetical protein
MNVLRHFMMSGLVVSLFFSSWCVADDGHDKTAIYKMAKIMYRLKHFPSPQGKTELQMIIDAPSSTKNERTIATAMINMEHQVAPDDILLLKKISANKASTQYERELAEILINFSHRPTKQDKNQLKEMMK